MLSNRTGRTGRTEVCSQARVYCGAREHSRHKSAATCEWLSAQDQTVTGADDLGQRHTSFLSEITYDGFRSGLSVYLTSFHHRRSISRRRVRRRSRAFPSSFLPFPSAPQPQNASLSEFYTKIRKSTWGFHSSEMHEPRSIPRLLYPAIHV